MSSTRFVMSLLMAAGAALCPVLAQQYVISTTRWGAPSADADTGQGRIDCAIGSRHRCSS